MKKSLWKNNFKEILKTRRRFISILVMAFLGVGFFSGLVATGPDMQESLDRYADSSHLFDIEILSTLGLTDEDIEKIKNVEGIENAVGVQTLDSIAMVDESEEVVKIIEYNENSNMPALVDGRLPEKSDECLLDRAYTIFDETTNYIGKKVIIENNEVDSEDNPIITQKEFTIVGICNSPLYISSQRGNTTVGSGNIGLYIYTKDDVLDLDYYTSIYATVDGATQLLTNSNEYLNKVNSAIENVEKIKNEREEARYNELVGEAESKLDDAQKEFDSKKSEVDEKLLDAEQQINNGKNELEKSEEKIKSSENELSRKEKQVNKQFDEAQKIIDNGRQELENGRQQLQASKEEFDSKKSEAEAGIVELDKGIQQAKDTLTNLQAQKEELVKNGADTSSIDAIIDQTQNTINDLINKKSSIENEINNAELQINNSENQILKSQTELDNNQKALNDEKNEANSQFKKAREEIKKGKEQIESGKIELEQKEQEFEDAKEEANSEISNAQKELDDAKEKIKQIEKAKWYIFDRTDNTGYTNILDAIKTISNISKMFPIIFYLIAILISLTSMTRMVEEERVEIGTLKALGYTNLQIVTKYIIYALLACMIGGILGMTVGFYLIPNIIWNIYSLLYALPKFYSVYRFDIGFLGLIIAFICIGGATLIVTSKELKSMPSALMRPKAPKNGKKILLEKIPFIWKKFNFSKKITARNIFRYKKRAIMTIIGIAGCTGLMLTGFGIKDSVKDIPESQFGKVFKYETMISLSNVDSLGQVKELLNSNDLVENYSEISATAGSLQKNDSKYDVVIFVPENNDSFYQVCSLNKVDNKNDKINLSDDGIVITDKIAELLDVSEGDTVTLIDANNIEYEFKVEAIAENYVSHYVYMSKNLYEQEIKRFETNTVLANTNNMSKEEKNTFSEDLLNIDGVGSVSMISDTIDTIDDMLNSLNYVVIILIVASALLDFVVLYNLANINIGERQREIATLKVLGFYDKEVDNYINKENVIFTVVGILLGLVFGYFLTEAIVVTVEIESLRFIRRILPISYLYAIAITALFSIVVNYIIHFVLKKIDMIESLKSVE